ncbi:MAG: DUF2269 family protein [Halofilum sp. (in: g-proteobacteria)]|nr:DUF2269 family protein [Halofilum sp. (in: g-proteobacteria)]
MSDWQQELRLLHLLAAAVLLGMRIGGGWYFARALRTREPAIIANAAHAGVIAELLLTTPAVVIQLLTGLALADGLGLSLATPWIAIAMGVFIAVGVIWLPLLWIEYRIATRASASALSTQRWVAWWYVLEWMMLFGVFVLFWLMVYRPY